MRGRLGGGIPGGRRRCEAAVEAKKEALMVGKVGGEAIKRWWEPGGGHMVKASAVRCFHMDGTREWNEVLCLKKHLAMSKPYKGSPVESEANALPAEDSNRKIPK
ncbi:hypothetical protein Scep_011935 [Stephania cephalantha]|uniref:Uncharacterized protein n=1 Tax=Stephania cephalantha TaxID=152367 RepID=A0AAP0JGB7_9MAGN